MIAILYMPLYKVYPYYPSPPFKKRNMLWSKIHIVNFINET